MNRRELLEEKWDVTIIVTYRRFAEWLLSVNRQYYEQAYERGNSRHWKSGAVLQPWIHVQNLWKKQPRSNGTCAVYNFYSYVDCTLPVWRNAGFRTAILNVHPKEKDVLELCLQL